MVEIEGTDQRVAGQIERAARAYLAAIDDRDAVRACELLEPGALRGIRLRGGPGCRSLLAASIGRRPPKDAPRWRGTEVEHLTRVSFSRGQARVTVEVVHSFAGGGTPSLEDDVVYLVRRGGRWLVAKPSATLYRAVGYPSPPLDALVAPS